MVFKPTDGAPLRSSRRPECLLPLWEKVAAKPPDGTSPREGCVCGASPHREFVAGGGAALSHREGRKHRHRKAFGREQCRSITS